MFDLTLSVGMMVFGWCFYAVVFDCLQYINIYIYELWYLYRCKCIVRYFGLSFFRSMVVVGLYFGFYATTSMIGVENFWPFNLPKIIKAVGEKYMGVR